MVFTVFHFFFSSFLSFFAFNFELSTVNWRSLGDLSIEATNGAAPGEQ